MTDTLRPQTSGSTIATDSPSSQVVTQNLGHLAFCALTALHLARQKETINSPYAENMFLTRWLSLAQKQKRFPKTVAQDIVWRVPGVQGEHGCLNEPRVYLECGIGDS
ncbi:DUF2913 family protein [Yersinia intermedia]|uniref:DUF2913 family protein n=1 Tax=Yersinia intermedia TaxID=631 RepID=UPI000B72F0FA|nr:DUF2913 family protein [Yersinia intermedia]MCW8114199.1 DUF2913 family protein [Yersinia intermedia]MDA5518975.1 DUF2913 family protein [Yersinia intermedia]OWF86873.1 hypothetical protein B4916_22375 [Yersinia intermedia]